MKHSQQLLLAACLFLAALPVGPTAAYDQPAGLNLGGTSFLDGIPPAGPGFYFQEYIGYYTADEFPESGAPMVRTRVDVWVSLNQFIYQSNQKLLSVASGASMSSCPSLASKSTMTTASWPTTAVGWATSSSVPFLQWDPIMGENGPSSCTAWSSPPSPPRASTMMTEPQPGQQLLLVQPILVGHMVCLAEGGVSIRVHYLWNAQNDDPLDTPARHSWRTPRRAKPGGELRGLVRDPAPAVSRGYQRV